MSSLIKLSDKNAFRNVNYIKNATYWKDLLAFYDAYILITSRTKDELPEFCFKNEKVNLDGICLLIKDSLAEFAFASLNPSIEYLKLLYYSMASYSRNGEVPNKNLILSDFHKYRISCKSAVEKSKELIQKNESVYEKKNEEFTNQSNYISDITKKISLTKYLMILSAIIMVLDIIFCCIGFIKLKSKMALVIFVFIVILALAVALAIVSFRGNKKYKSEYNWKKNSVVKLNNQTNDNKINITKEKLVVHKLVSENYEYNNNLSRNIYDRVNHNFFMVLNDIQMKKDLYFSQTIHEIELSHNRDIDNIILNLSRDTIAFDEVYNQILSKNWLYYNLLVRYKFISVFVKSAINSHEWMVKVNDEMQYPFGINMKDFVSEKVLFLPEGNNEAYCLKVEDILKTSTLGNYKLNQFRTALASKDSRFYKMQYITQFFAPQFITKKSGDIYKLSVSENSESNLDNLNKFTKIPTLFEVDEKLQNQYLGLDNSDEKTLNLTLKQIYENLPNINDYIDTILPKENSSEAVTLTIDNLLDDIVNINAHTTICSFGDKKIVGYRIET